MKPIATLMKPLRSVDLDTLDRGAGGDRAQRRLRGAGRRGGRRGDGRVRPRRRVPREVRRRLDRGDRSGTTTRTRRARSAAASRRTADLAVAMIRPILRYGADVLHAARRARRRDHAGDPAAHRRHDPDDVRRAGDRPGRPAGRRRRCGSSSPTSRSAATRPICSSSSTRSSSSATACSSRRKAASACPGFNATVARPSRAVRQGARPRRRRAGHRRHRPAGALLPARDGSPRRDAVRRSAARAAEGPDRPQDQEAARAGKW